MWVCGHFLRVLGMVLFLKYFVSLRKYTRCVFSLFCGALVLESACHIYRSILNIKIYLILTYNNIYFT